MTMDETIFVSIPSYRDPECSATIKDLFLKASQPQRVFVGICYQLQLNEGIVDNNDWSHLSLFDKTSNLQVLRSPDRFECDPHKACWLIPKDNDERRLTLSDLVESSSKKKKESYQPRVSQVRFVVLRSQDARGPCLARHLAHKLYKGERYQMSIDSHMRFDVGWDDIAIKQLQSCQELPGELGDVEKRIVTTYPASYEPPNTIHYEKRPIAMVAKGFGPQDKMLRMTGKIVREAFSKPHLSPFWAAGFNFSLGRVLMEVPYDPTLDFLFFGEECSMIVRLYTKGYRFFVPTTNFIYHLWTRSGRPSFREVKVQDREETEQRSLRRVQAMLGIISDENSSYGSASEEYGLGSASTLSDYESFSGVSFATQTLIERAQCGLLSPSQFVGTPEEEIMRLLTQLKT